MAILTPGNIGATTPLLSDDAPQLSLHGRVLTVIATDNLPAVELSIVVPKTIMEISKIGLHLRSEVGSSDIAGNLGILVQKGEVIVLGFKDNKTEEFLYLIVIKGKNIVVFEGKDGMIPPANVQKAICNLEGTF